MKGLLFSTELKDVFKLSETDFTRSRKQSFCGTLLFMINRITKSLSIEIDNFVRVLNRNQDSSNAESFTKSAFVQYRKKINPEVFNYLSKNLVKEFYTDNDDSILLWKGLRLLAVDGSRLTLPNTPKLQHHFGKVQNQSETIITQARISVLYDVLNGFVIDGKLSPLLKSENDLALEHLDYANVGDLILYDRGYPAFELMYEHRKRGIDFLFRVQSNFNNQVKEFLATKKQMQICLIYPSKNTKFAEKEYLNNFSMEVRLNKVILPDGTIEVLISSLLDEGKYENSLFKDLYFKRWRIETFYDEIKNKLKLGNFSGYSIQTIYQDFYSTLFVSNVQSLLVKELNEELEQKKDQTKYIYKVNANISYGILKDRIIEIFLSKNEMDIITKEIKDLLIKNLIPIRPDRSLVRNTGIYRKRTKPNITKNQKDAF